MSVVAEQRPDQAGEQYNIFDNNGHMVDVLQRRSWQAVGTQYSQRIHLASTGRQQAADVVRDCQTVVELNAKCRHTGDPVDTKLLRNLFAMT